MPMDQKFTVVCGHYGCGKTNLSINLALDRAAQGKRVTLADLDLVNPYFRSSDYRERLEESGVEVIAPVFAGSNLDLPAISPELYSLFAKEGEIILDVGGDDAGATVLGGFSHQIRELPYEMLYVVNRYRVLSTTAREAAQLLREIEAVSRLKATGVVNNSHLKEQTTAEDILLSVSFAKEVAEELGLPLLYTTVPKRLEQDVMLRNLYPVSVYVRSPWEETIS